MNNRLPVLAALVTLTACASSPAQPAFDAATLAGSTWIQGQSATDQGSGLPRLSFSHDSVKGTGGCNSFSGKAELAGNKVVLGSLASTKKMCIGPSQAVEDVFFRALSDTRSARKDGDQLLLLNEKGEELARLHPAPGRP